jgi:hypothetical protein
LLRHRRRSNLRQIHLRQIRLRVRAGGNSLRPLVRLNLTPVAGASEETLPTCRNKTLSVRGIAASTRAAVETRTEVRLTINRPDNLLETHRDPVDLLLRRLNNKLRPIALTRDRSLRRTARLSQIRAAEILDGQAADNPDRIIPNRVNHRGSIKTILAGTPADLVTAGHLSICSSLS